MHTPTPMNEAIEAVDETLRLAQQLVEKLRGDLRERMGKCGIETHGLWIFCIAPERSGKKRTSAECVSYRPMW